MAENYAAGGGNPGGFNGAGGIGPVPTTGVMGDSGGYNPLMPTMPSNQQWPGLSSPYSFGANSNPSASAPMPNSVVGNLGGALTPNLQRAFTDAGAPSGVAASLADFLKSGAGYNPQILQSLIAQLQPQISRGETDIMGQFGGAGLGQSSAAATGMGDYLSQVNLNESNMATQLYEQAINNYMQVMLGGSNWQSQSSPGFWQTLGEGLLSNVLGGAGQAGTSIVDKGITNMGGGGASSSFGGLSGAAFAAGIP